MTEKQRTAIEKRLDNIEEIMKLLLLSNVFNSDGEEKVKESVKKEAEQLLSPLNLKNTRLNYIEGVYYIFVDIDGDMAIGDIKKIFCQACELLGNIKIVFAFERLHPKRKKALIDAEISFYIVNGELRIF